MNKLFNHRNLMWFCVAVSLAIVTGIWLITLKYNLGGGFNINRVQRKTETVGKKFSEIWEEFRSTITSLEGLLNKTIQTNEVPKSDTATTSPREAEDK